jgi:PAS domain S-box-containing protein
MQIDRPIPELSPREQQLLQFAAEGLTDTAIANHLGISEATVGTYWGRVRIKLGPYSRTELVAIVMRAEREAAVDALRRENDELVKQLHEKGGADSSLYHDLLENAPDAIMLVTETGEIEYANLAAQELFGYEKGEAQGHHVSELVPPRYRDRHGAHISEYVADPKRREMGVHLETPAVRKDGTEFLIRAALSAMTTPSGMIITCVIRSVKLG